jgi:Ser-tRNA(Ala) deacylase AlaX
MHTAAHMLSAIINTRSGALITGNQLGTDKSRMDFSLENFDRDAMASICEAANTRIKEDHAVKIYFLPREEAMKIPSVVKLAGALPPNLETLRIVEIESVDKSLDGGTHVANLAEIGTIEIVKMENKGKSNRRVYFAVKP